MAKKKYIASAVATGVVLLGLSGSGSTPQASKSASPQVKSESISKAIEPPAKVKQVCDGVNVKSDCTLEGASYKTYVYHPAVPEKSHTEQVTTYNKEVTGYCTLCGDGTYSPSCATGRGACSWHGGVAQWNAPRYGNVPVTSTKTVVDEPAKAAYYEKVVE
jgi:hypothetical protein